MGGTHGTQSRLNSASPDGLWARGRNQSNTTWEVTGKESGWGGRGGFQEREDIGGRKKVKEKKKKENTLKKKIHR